LGAVAPRDWPAAGSLPYASLINVIDRIELFDGRGEVRSAARGRLEQVPPAMMRHFAPVRLMLFEWQDYWLRCTDADEVVVGNGRAECIGKELFRLRFENQLGVTRVQPMRNGRPLAPAEYFEVISAKFPTAELHATFLHTLLRDLADRASALAFALDADTGRSTNESPDVPGPIFTLYFLQHHLETLRLAWHTIEAHPHRALIDSAELVPIHAASEVDGDTLLDILQNPQRWVRGGQSRLSARLDDHLPQEVWQCTHEETLDTPENRFVREYFVRLQLAVGHLMAQPWWGHVPRHRQQIVREASTLIERALASAALNGVGRSRRVPVASRMLMRREGYREMRQLWDQTQLARSPVFNALQHAVDVRDVATLYETWVFFSLIDQIAAFLGVTPTIHMPTSASAGLQWSARASFAAVGRLAYNRTLPSYSVPLRPDYVWEVGGRPLVALDAKFRADRTALDGGGSAAFSTAKQVDIHKMHTYRDALGVRAAVILYPGDESVFYDAVTPRADNPTIDQLLTDDWSGVGAIALNPVQPTTRET
jgi:uncharacterized protein